MVKNNEKISRTKRIGFLGTGNLTTMLVRRFVQTGSNGRTFVVSARSLHRSDALAREFGVSVARTPQELSDSCDTLFICLPIAGVSEILRQMSFRTEQRVISMVGGLLPETLRAAVKPAQCACAMLAGLPSQLGIGLTIVSPPMDEVLGLLERFGYVVPCESTDIFTRLSTYAGLSGCLFHQSKVIADAFEKIGVEHHYARTLVSEAYRGVGHTLMHCQNNTIDSLVKLVVSPGGVTERGIAELHSLDEAWENALQVMADAFAANLIDDETIPRPEA